VFSSKDPSEEITLTFDYSAAAGTVTSPSVTVRVVKGIDANANAMLSGSPQVSDGTKVLQKVIGGLRNCDYEFRCLATVNGDRPLIRDVLPVRTECHD
jgi:hypothetical protein